MTAMPMPNAPFGIPGSQQSFPFFNPSAPLMPQQGGGSWMSNPFLHLGAGILGSNRRGVGTGQAIGQGLLGGMQSYQQQARQAAAIEQARALQQIREQQLAMAQAKAAREEKAREADQATMEKFQQYIASKHPELAGLPYELQKGVVKQSMTIPEATTLMQNLAAAGQKPGTPEYEATMLKMLTQPRSSTTVNVPVTVGGAEGRDKFYERFSGKMGEQAAKDWSMFDKDVETQTAFQDAIGLIDKGIFTGTGSNLVYEAAKAAGVNEGRVANTEAFRAIVGDQVLARMKDIGGNDTEREMQKVEQILAGDITMSEKGLKEILLRAQRKIDKKLKRVRTRMQDYRKRGYGYVNPAMPEQPDSSPPAGNVVDFNDLP